MNKFARIRKLTSSLSPWVKNMKTEKMLLCESVGELKVIVNQGEVKMKDMNIHTIDDLQRYF